MRFFKGVRNALLLSLALWALILLSATAFAQSSVLPYYYNSGGTKQAVGTSFPLPVTVISGGGGGAVTIADGADVTQGAIADSAYAGVGSATNNSILKGIYTSVNSAIPAGSAIIGNVRIDQTTPGTTNGVVATGNVAAGATDSGNPIKVGGKYNSTKPTLTDGLRGDVQLGTRGSQLVTLTVTDSTAAFTAGSATANTNGTSILGSVPVAQLDDVSPTAITENNFGNLRMAPNHALLTKPYSTTAGGDWTYAAAASGISNTTTAVTVKTAGSGTDRNCVTAIDLTSTALGAATEFAIRDGTGGTVLWRITVSTAGLISGLSKTFPTPICGTAATLLEVVTLTASITGTVYVNAQGYAAP